MLKPFEVFVAVFMTLICIDRIVHGAKADFDLWSTVIDVLFILFTSGYYSVLTYAVQMRKRSTSKQKEKI